MRRRGGGGRGWGGVEAVRQKQQDSGQDSGRDGSRWAGVGGTCVRCRTFAAVRRDL